MSTRERSLRRNRRERNHEQRERQDRRPDHARPGPQRRLPHHSHQVYAAQAQYAHIIRHRKARVRLIVTPSSNCAGCRGGSIRHTGAEACAQGGRAQGHGYCA
jgi:hypothetical protein